MVDFAILQRYNTNLAFEKRKKKIILSWLYIHISRIDYDSTWSHDCEICKKKKKNGCEGDKKRKGPLPDLVLGMGYSHIWVIRPIYLPKFMKT